MLEIFKSIEKKTSDGKVSHIITQIDEISENTWIHLQEPTEEEMLLLEEKLDVSREFLTNPLDDEERPRVDVDEENGDTLIILDIPYMMKDKKLWTVPLGIIIKKRYIITVSLRDVPLLEPFKTNQVKDLVVNFRNRFAIMILLHAAKDYLKWLKYIDKKIESTEKELARSTDNEQLYELLEVSKTLVYFSTSLKSDEAVLEKLTRWSVILQYDEDQNLLEDVIIEFKQAREMSDIYTSVVSHTMEAYASIINNNINEIMKIMAAATIALSVPTIISSFFGQNCPMPWDVGFSSNPIPFLILTLAGFCSVICAILILKKHRML
ncbi:MAG: magnesium transporter CorA family protein [Clostridiales bacterium]|nr:magnesium transporter CorA family protein [Clostridiales bacterium]